MKWKDRPKSTNIEDRRWEGKLRNDLKNIANRRPKGPTKRTTLDQVILRQMKKSGYGK